MLHFYLCWGDPFLRFIFSFGKTTSVLWSQLCNRFRIAKRGLIVLPTVRSVNTITVKIRFKHNHFHCSLSCFGCGPEHHPRENLNHKSYPPSRASLRIHNLPSSAVFTWWGVKTPKKTQSEYWKQNKGHRSKPNHRGWRCQRLVTKILTPLWNCLGHKCGVELFLPWWNLFPLLFSILHPLLMSHMESSSTLSGVAKVNVQ